jgi:hypothetical protein
MMDNNNKAEAWAKADEWNVLPIEECSDCFEPIHMLNDRCGICGECETFLCADCGNNECAYCVENGTSSGTKGALCCDRCLCYCPLCGAEIQINPKVYHKICLGRHMRLCKQTSVVKQEYYNVLMRKEVVTSEIDQLQQQMVQISTRINNLKMNLVLINKEADSCEKNVINNMPSSSKVPDL